MITANDIVNILTSPLVNRLNFCMRVPSGMVRIYPSGYHAIASRIRDGSIALESTTELASNVSAFFRTHWPRTPTIVTNQNASAASLVDQMTIIHECTHALFHYNGITLPLLYNESMCFIAEAVYLAAAQAEGRSLQCFSDLGIYESISNTAQRVVSGTLYEILMTLEIDQMIARVAELYHAPH